MAAAAASGQRGEGAPSPSRQAGSEAPASRAAPSIARAPSGLAAAQALSAASPPSIAKRSVKGAMTGRGALTSRSSASPSGRARPRSARIRRRSSGLSAAAVIATRSESTEICERGKPSAAASA